VERDFEGLRVGVQPLHLEVKRERRRAPQLPLLGNACRQGRMNSPRYSAGAPRALSKRARVGCAGRDVKRLEPRRRPSEFLMDSHDNAGYLRSPSAYSARCVAGPVCHVAGSP
jgi:hypothetical protein